MFFVEIRYTVKEDISRTVTVLRVEEVYMKHQRIIVFAAILAALLLLLSIGCDQTPAVEPDPTPTAEAITPKPVDTRVQLSTGPVERDVTELTLNSVTEDDLAALSELRELRLLDGRACGDAALLKAFSETVSYPVLWSVPFGDTRIDSDADALAVPASVTAAQDVIDALALLPHVTSVDLTDSGLNNEQTLLLLEAVPTVSVRYAILVQGTRVAPDSMELTLSADGIGDWDALKDELALLPSLTRITVEGRLSPDRAKRLLEAAGETEAVYTVAFGNTAIESTSEEADLSALSPSELNNIIGAVAVLPNLKRVNLNPESGQSKWTLDDANRLQTAREGLLVDYRTEAFGVTFSLADEVVSFSGVDLKKRVDDVKALLPYLCNVQRLDMEDCGVDNETMAALRDEFPQPKIVWTVTVGGYNPIRTDAIMIKFSAAGRRTLYDKDVKNLKYCRDLKYIDLGHNKLHHMDFVKYMPDLEVFIMFNPVSDLKGIENCTKLEYFECFSTVISDLTPLAACTELKHLNLCFNNIKDITPLYGLTNLERLWISRNKIPEEQIEEFKSRVPNCVVNNTTHNPTGEGWRTDENGNYVERYALLREQFQYDKTELRSY